LSIAELRNDHKDITNKIEKNLEALHTTKLTRSEQPTPRSSGKFNSVLTLNCDECASKAKDLGQLYLVRRP
jgi:hypothetical protein